MTVFLNGEFVSEERAVVSVFDRSFRYGDGLFETVRVLNGKLFRWNQHFERVQRSAQFLRIPLPFSSVELQRATLELTERNGFRDAIVRLSLSRGSGPRGYAPGGDEKPLVVITAHSTISTGEALWKLITSSLRIPAGDVLQQHKTASRLLNVLAGIEARERGADETLLLDTDGNVTEGTASNVFWIERGRLATPPISAGVLPGITRGVVFELCQQRGMPIAEQSISPAALLRTEGVFMTLTSRGIVEAVELDGKALARSPLARELAAQYRAVLQRECA